VSAWVPGPAWDADPTAAVPAPLARPGELAQARGDHRAAFVRYESRLRKYAKGCQAGGERTGKFLAPATATGIRLRNTLLSRPFVLNGMLTMGEKVSSTVDPPDYSGAEGVERAT
jgi:hypothetical protein